jgi:uncharacterized repeat protein (TIGR01451 family)
MKTARMARLVACTLITGGVAAFMLAVQHALAAPRLPAVELPETADLVITKTVAPTTTLRNKGVLFFMTIRNTGATTATSVVMTDPLPSGLILGYASVECSNTGDCNLAYVGRTLSVTVASMTSASQVNVRVEVTPTFPSAITNVAYVSAGGGGELDPATNVSTATLIVSNQERFLPIIFSPP